MKRRGFLAALAAVAAAPWVSRQTTLDLGRWYPDAGQYVPSKFVARMPAGPLILRQDMTIHFYDAPELREGEFLGLRPPTEARAVVRDIDVKNRIVTFG